MKVKPLGNKVVIEVDTLPEEYTTKAGLVIPDFGKVKQMNVQTGVVVATGQGIRNAQGEFNRLTVRVGDRIVFNHHALFKCTVESGDASEEFLYLNEADIVAILETD